MSRFLTGCSQDLRRTRRNFRAVLPSIRADRLEETMNATDETRIAEEIVGVLPEGSVVRVCSDDRESLRFAVRDAALKLRSIVLRRSSLRRLFTDPARAIKVEY